MLYEVITPVASPGRGQHQIELRTQAGEISDGAAVARYGQAPDARQAWCQPATDPRSALARIFHQDADFWVVLGEPGRARPSQPIDHSIGKTGMREMAVQNEP